MDNNQIDMNQVAQSLVQKLASAEYTASAWEAKAKQLMQENQQLKQQLNNKKANVIRVLSSLLCP